MKNVSLAQKITESGLMIALATILSIVKLFDLPYGGSITFASMLPVMIIAYRYGTVWGVVTGTVYGVIQLILGSSSLSYATSFTAAIAIILLDYILAFALVGIAGIFKPLKNKTLAFGAGTITACLLRYIMHVISGCTVWAGLSIPTASALSYSLIYNATYMIPETIVTVVTALYIASVIDFSLPKLTVIKREHTSKKNRIINILSGLTGVLAITVISVLTFPHLQNADSGEFDITGIKNVNTTAVIITLSVSVVIIAALFIIKKIRTKKD